MFQLSIRSDDGDVVVVNVQGSITPQESDAAAEPLAALLGAGVYRRRVLLDLQQAEFIDSSGVSWLLVCHKNIRAAGGRLVLFNIPPLIDRVLKVLRMELVFCLAAKEQAARAAVSGDEK